MTAALQRRRIAWLAAALAGIVIILFVVLMQPKDAVPGPGNSARVMAQNAASSVQQFPAASVCIGCHSPTEGPPLAGILLGRWLAPNITPDPISGIGAWSRDDIFRYLRYGNAPGRSQAAGPMAPIVEMLQTSSDADLNALIDWLAGQPAHRDSADKVPASERGERLTVDPMVLRGAGAVNTVHSGATLYNGSCAVCHGADGAGSPSGYYPSLFHNSSVGRRTPFNLLAVLLSGVKRNVGGEPILMQSFDGHEGVVGGLSDDELAALANFVITQFGNPATAKIERPHIESSRAGWWDQGEPTVARGKLIAVGGGPGGPGAACFSCHGLQGQGDAGAAFPRLAGLAVGYFAKQMRDYASGARPNDTMSRIAQQLDPVDYHSLALYYAELPADAPAIRLSAPDKPLVNTGEMLYLQGAAARGIQACADCHGPGGHGFDPVYPSVLQPASYTAEQLRLWRAGVRHNDPHDLMGRAARSMTDDDIGAVAAYLAGLAR